jgi:hypothetical protein
MSEVMKCIRCGEDAVWIVKVYDIQLGSNKCACPCHQPGNLTCLKEAA